MALGKIRRWNARKSGVGPIWQFWRWVVSFFHDFSKSVSGFRRWFLRKSGLEPQDVSGGLAAVRVRLLGADAVDQAQFFQRRQVVVQGGDGHFGILGQPRLRRETAEVRVVAIAEKPQHDLGGRLQPALLDGPVGGGVAHGKTPDMEKGLELNTGPDKVGRGRKRRWRAVPWRGSDGTAERAGLPRC